MLRDQLRVNKDSAAKQLWTLNPKLFRALMISSTLSTHSLLEIEYFTKQNVG